MSSDSAELDALLGGPSRTVSQTRQSGVTVKSSRFIDTWARPSSSSSEAVGLDLGQAAARLADARAMRLASSTSSEPG